MLIELIFGLLAIAAVSTLFWKSGFVGNGNQGQCKGWLQTSPSSLDQVASFAHQSQQTISSRQTRDVLDDYALQLEFTPDNIESSANHHLQLADHLLQEAELETARLEILIDKLGFQLSPLFRTPDDAKNEIRAA